MSTRDEWVMVDLDDDEWAEVAAKVDEMMSRPPGPRHRQYPTIDGKTGEPARREHQEDASGSERAAAKWLGLPWTDAPSGPDVGDDVQVRTSRHNSARLPLRGTADVEQLYLLVWTDTRTPRRFWMVGWLPGRLCWVYGDLERDKLAEEGVYWVKQRWLRPPDSLLVKVAGVRR